MPRSFPRDLVAAQVVLTARIAAARAAAGGLGALVGVEAVSVRVPDVDGDAAQRLTALEHVDRQLERDAVLRDAGRGLGPPGVRPNVRAP